MILLTSTSLEARITVVNHCTQAEPHAFESALEVMVVVITDSVLLRGEISSISWCYRATNMEMFFLSKKF
jgi:hypothetical protein